MNEGMDDWVGHDHGLPGEEAGRWKAKVKPGTMRHQAGWPGEDVSPALDPSLCAMQGKAPCEGSHGGDGGRRD